MPLSSMALNFIAKFDEVNYDRIHLKEFGPTKKNFVLMV